MTLSPWTPPAFTLQIKLRWRARRGNTCGSGGPVPACSTPHPVISPHPSPVFIFPSTPGTASCGEGKEGRRNTILCPTPAPLPEGPTDPDLRQILLRIQ